jgi:hypothetical protein
VHGGPAWAVCRDEVGSVLIAAAILIVVGLVMILLGLPGWVS